MNCRTIFTAVKLARVVENPLPAVFDRLGLRREPYRARLRNGQVLQLRPGRGDLASFREVWLNELYTSQGQMLRPGDTVIDVGANIGCFSLFAAHRVGPQGRVLALEPEAETFQQLRRNIELNRAANVAARQIAVAAESGEAILYGAEDSRYCTLFRCVDQRATHQPVGKARTDSLERILEQEGIEQCHYLKLDCEGAEHDMIRTLSPEIAGRIDQITLEMHQVDGVDSDALTRRLESFGFQWARRGEIFFFRKV